MRRFLLTIVLSLIATLVPTLTASPAWANPAMDGTWRVAVMKDGTKKTWSATVKDDKGKDAKGKKRSGTYEAKGDKVTLTESGSKKSHELRVFVKGNQMVLSPVDRPKVRLVALKVE